MLQWGPLRSVVIFSKSELGNMPDWEEPLLWLLGSQEFIRIGQYNSSPSSATHHRMAQHQLEESSATLPKAEFFTCSVIQSQGDPGYEPLRTTIYFHHFLFQTHSPTQPPATEIQLKAKHSLAFLIPLIKSSTCTLPPPDLLLWSDVGHTHGVR